MGNDIIQAQYDELATVASRFGGQAEATKQMIDRVRQTMQPLQQGGWQGRGSAVFFAEMNRDILPAVQRMAAALNQARTVTLKVRDVMKAAEEEASAAFKSNGAGKMPDAAAGHYGSGETPIAAQGKGSATGHVSVTSDQPASRQPTKEAGQDHQLTILNLAVTIPNLFAQGWLTTGKGLMWEGPFFSRQLTNWRGQLLAITKPPAYGVLPSASDDAVKAFAQSQGKTGFAETLANSKVLKTVGRGLAVFDFGSNLQKLGSVLDKPATEIIEASANTTASGLGVVGAFFSGPGAALAGAFSVGYSIGGVIEDLTGEYMSNKLADGLTAWDPLDLGYSPGKYPRSTVKEYQRNGREMSLDTAADVFRGLQSQYGRSEAVKFATEYAQRNGIPIEKFRDQLPWYERALDW